MAKVGKFRYKRNGRRRFRSQDTGSDESDEDYMIGEDEELNDSDAYCSSFDGNESEESLGEFEEEVEEEMVKKAVRLKKPGQGCLNNKTNRVKQMSKRRRVSYKEDDNDEEYDDNDKDFTPDEIDTLDDDEEFVVKKKTRKTGRPQSQKNDFAKGQKKKSYKVTKKTTRKKLQRDIRLKRSASSSGGWGFRDKVQQVEENSKKISHHKRRRRYFAYSDSDSLTSGSSDYDYTGSEKEREQMREASMATSLRSSFLSRRLQGEKEKVPFHQLRKHVRRKDKKKLEDLKDEVGKQVCGICLSEEGKKTIRGTLSCCSHYFCFACIMEWSKVESRCPLCKQRFVAVSKAARLNAGFDLRNTIINVPERDQVYQPSEEELRSYLDPYENVICSECQQGGDDALMLLCDLCDSPAHTYCVGLGREVPEGSWYCEGCRPTAFGSSNPYNLNHTPDQSRISNFSGRPSLAGNDMEGVDLNVAYVPETPLSQGNFSSPRISNIRNIFNTSSSGSGAFTVLERRRIHHQIQRVINNNRIRELAIGANGMHVTSLGTDIFGSQLDQGRELAPQQIVPPQMVASASTSFGGILENNSTPLAHSRVYVSTRLSQSRDSLIHNQTSTSVNRVLDAEFAGITSRINPIGLPTTSSFQ